MHNITSSENILSCDMILFSESGNYYPEGPQILAVIEGEVSVSANNPSLKKGSVFFTVQEKVHFRIDNRCVLIRIILNPAFLLYQFPKLFEFDTAFFKFNNPEKIFEFTVEYANLFFTETCSSLRSKSFSFFLLEKLEDFIGQNIESISGGSENSKAKKTKHSEEILDYISNNIFRNITSSSVSNHFSVSPQYLASIIKKSTGYSFSQYLSYLRIKKGKAYYKYTSLKKEKIIDLLNIKDTDVFEKEILSCVRIKDKFTAKPQIYSVFNKATALTYIFNFDSQTGKKLNNVSENVVYAGGGNSEYIFPVWKQLINLGYAVYFDNRQTFNQLIITQKKIGFQYGRLCRVLDLIVSYQSDRQIIYDYNRIFRILDVIIENNMFPFIELGNKRLRIQLNIENTLVPDVPKEHQEYFEYLLEMLPGFICSCINRYGYNSISNWKFEVSAPEYESTGTDVNFSLSKYAVYFSKIKKCIQKYVPNCKVGGPGFNNWDSPEIFHRLLDFLQSNNSMPDFLTAYMYPLDKAGYTMRISSNQNLLENRMNLLQNAIENKQLKIELWITEFNSNLSSRNFINDSSYQAAFIAKTMLAAIRQKIRGIGYYLMSDEPLRYADTINFLFGGWGLFTDKSIPKPSFHSLNMFAMLGTQLEKLSDKYIITSDADKNYQILLLHYEHLTDEYCQKNVLPEDFRSPENIFIKNRSDSWNIVFNSLHPGYYLIKEYSVAPNKGNILYQWSSIHFLTPLKDEHQRLIESLSAITPSLSCVRVSDDAPLSLNYILSRQNLKFISVEYISRTDKKERNLHDE